MPIMKQKLKSLAGGTFSELFSYHHTCREEYNLSSHELKTDLKLTLVTLALPARIVCLSSN